MVSSALHKDWKPGERASLALSKSNERKSISVLPKMSEYSFKRILRF